MQFLGNHQPRNRTLFLVIFELRVSREHFIEYSFLVQRISMLDLRPADKERQILTTKDVVLRDTDNPEE